MRGKTDWEAAAREAYEEAGLVGEIEQTPVGRYPYWKRLTAHFVLIDATVYLMRVEKLLNKWPEKAQRKRRWMSLPEAAEEVLEPGLIAIFMQLEGREGRLCRKTSTGQPAVAPALR